MVVVIVLMSCLPILFLPDRFIDFFANGWEA